MSDSEADKKRNKLGYQRISIACAHCRRRKIRCLLAEKDPQGRCQNCIRLKKECIFYPIDQQGAYESRSDHSSRRGVGSASSSGVSSTSPDIQATHSHGLGRPQYTPLGQSAVQSAQLMPFESSAPYQAPYLPVDRPYQETLPSHSPWPPPASRSYELASHSHLVSAGQTQQPQFWAFDQSAGSGDFAPFPNEAAQQVRTPSTPFNAQFVQQSSPEQQWQLQQPHHSTRSMTYPLPASSMPISLPPSYAGELAHQTPPASYPPFSVPQESPQMLHQMQGPPFSTPISQSHSFPEHGVQYHRGPSEHQHGALPVQQGYSMGWDPSSSALGFSVDEQHSIPSTRPPPYVVPSQRPR